MKYNYFVLFIVIVLILCILIVYDYLYTIHETACISKNKLKFVFLYNSSNKISLDFISNLYTPIKLKYEKNQNMNFVLIDVINNKKYIDNINSLPQIYFIDYDRDTMLIFPANQELNYTNLNNFIINSSIMINQ